MPRTSFHHIALHEIKQRYNRSRRDYLIQSLLESDSESKDEDCDKEPPPLKSRFGYDSDDDSIAPTSDKGYDADSGSDIDSDDNLDLEELAFLQAKTDLDKILQSNILGTTKVL